MGGRAIRFALALLILTGLAAPAAADPLHISVADARGRP